MRLEIEKLEDRYNFKLLFTDNHSSDDTYRLLSELASKDARIKVISFSKNFGYQRSIHTGYVNCNGDAAIQLDCDLQNRPEIIPIFIKKWKKDLTLFTEYEIPEMKDF